jgi:antitoxin ParD1/3/4
MEVRLTPEQERLIQAAVAEGRYGNAEEALKDALALWQENERRLVELRALIAEGDRDLAEGRYTEYDDESIKTLADELISEARALRDAGQL